MSQSQTTPLHSSLFFNNTIEAVEKSQQFINREFEAQKEKINELEGIIKGMKSSNSSFDDRFRTILDSVDNLGEFVEYNASEIEELDLYMRRNNLEFHGIPLHNQENTDEIVKHIGSCLGVKIQDYDLSISHRLPSKKTDRPPPIIARFASRKIRNFLYRSRKTYQE